MTVDSSKRNLNWFLRVKSLGAIFRKKYPTVVIGRENIPAGEAFAFIVGPHKSMYETIVVPAYLQEIEFHIMIKDSLFVFGLGAILRSAGAIPVNRSGKGILAIEAAAADLERGYSTMAYLEGTRFPEDNYLHRGKTGVVRSALMAGKKVIPVGIRGMMPSDPEVPREIHIGQPINVVDRLAEIVSASEDELSPATSLRLLTDSIMEDVADLADVIYEG